MTFSDKVKKGQAAAPKLVGLDKWYEGEPGNADPHHSNTLANVSTLSTKITVVTITIIMNAARLPVWWDVISAFQLHHKAAIESKCMLYSF